MRKLLALLLLGLTFCAAAGERIRSDLANLRVAAHRDARIITALPRGAAVTLLEWSDRYARVRVAATGLTGWVYAPAQGWEPPSGAAAQAGADTPTGAATNAASAAAAAPAAAKTLEQLFASEPKPAARVPAAAITAPPAGTAPSPRAGAAEEALAPLGVGQLHLAMDAREAEILFRKPPGDRSSFPVAVLDAGKRLEGKVVVRGAFSRNFLKKSLIVTLPKGSEWQGHRRLSLTALATDPSRMRDFLAWRLIHHLGMAAPRVRYLDLFLNDEYLGLYLLVEWIDEKVFARHGLGEAGEFFQPNDLTYCGDFTEVQFARLKDCWEKLSPRDDDLSRLAALYRDILATPAERFDEFLDARFEARSVIDWLIVVALTSSGDTYNKNYFLRWSRDSDRWTVVPWDFDQSFGRVGDEGAPYPLSIWNDNFVYYLPPELGSDNPLKEKTLRNPRLYARYKARMAELLAPGPCEQPCASAPAGWFHPSRFAALVDAAAALAAPRPEKYPPVAAERFPLQVDALKHYNEWRFHYLHKLILEPTVFDTPLWLPYAAFAPLTPPDPDAPPVRRRFPLSMSATRTQAAGEARVFYLDTWLARPLAAISTRGLDAPLEITVEVESEQVPRQLPPGVAARECLERSWFLRVRTPGRHASARLEIDWIQEGSTHHELGEGVTDEARLALWGDDGGGWRRLPATVNPVANALVADGVELDAARPLRLVACVGSP